MSNEQNNQIIVEFLDLHNNVRMIRYTTCSVHDVSQSAAEK